MTRLPMQQPKTDTNISDFQEEYVMQKSSVWKVLSGISFFVSLIFLYMGFDKIYSYDNGELYPYTYHNAYVGGDAYNYIINGNYATAFFVLTLTFAMLGIGFCVLAYLSKISLALPEPVIPQCACEDNASESSEENSSVVETTEPASTPVEDAEQEECSKL